MSADNIEIDWQANEQTLTIVDDEQPKEQAEAYRRPLSKSPVHALGNDESDLHQQQLKSVMIQESTGPS